MCILNKFSVDTKPHDSITVDYYTFALPNNIALFVKWAAKPTLLECCEDDISVEKDLHTIRVIKDEEPTKDSKDASKKSQVMESKGRDKEATNIGPLTRLIKNLTTEVSKLKQLKIDTYESDHLSR